LKNKPIEWVIWINGDMGVYSGFAIQEGSDIPSVRISWDVSTGSSCLGRNTGTRNVFNIVMIVSINMGDYTMREGFFKEKDRGLALSSLGSF
jgi:hypothetical protein